MRSAFSIFLITKDSERELKNLLLLLQRIDTVKTENDLPSLQALLDQKSTDLRAIIAKIADADVDAGLSSQMSKALQTIKKRAANVAVAKRAS